MPRIVDRCGYEGVLMASLRRPGRGAARQLYSLLGVVILLAAVALYKSEGEWFQTSSIASKPSNPGRGQAKIISGSDSVAESEADVDGQAGEEDGAEVVAAPPPPPLLPPPAPRLKVTAAMKKKCQGTLGTWCLDYLSQVPVPAVTAPRGSKNCSLDCNKVGTCSALTGLCNCPAGWTGFNCLLPLKRYCTHKFRWFGLEPQKMEPDLSVGVGKDNFWDLPYKRCAGYCDDDLAACYCPSNTTYGHIPAAPDAPLGSPPVKQGRPIGLWCQPNKTPEGNDTAWGTVDPEQLFGPDGWCNAEEPAMQCLCYMEGWGGHNCAEPYEQFCFNQCNGHGTCSIGYCKCDPGWHGIDCAHRSTEVDANKPGRDAELPWVAENVHTPAAKEFKPGDKRKRPLIYVYELPADYNTLIMQYRHGGEDCSPRFYSLPGNKTVLSSWTYSLESGLLEMILQSEHRTLNPEEADFFYVPVFPSCYMFPVRASTDSVRDFYYGIGNNRAQSATNLLLETYHWLRSHFTYWDRRGGKDHIWLVTHDEASCYVPAAIRSSIILSHWGRMDLNHTTNTGYWEDEYSREFTHPQWEPDGFLWKIAGHACYDPKKDLIVPLMKTPNHFHASPLLGGLTRKRTWLAFHRGRVQPDNAPYSRGIRQRLAKATKAGDWFNKYKIAIGESDVLQGDYSELMSSSIFCLVLPGDGWSARMDDATLNGCIPVIIMDNVHVSFESIIDLSTFTVRIDQEDAEKLPEILQAIPEKRRQEMRRNLARVWQKFAYTSYRPYARRVKELQQKNGQGQTPEDVKAKVASLPATVPDLDPYADDAFGTIMAWLYSRIEATR